MKVVEIVMVISSIATMSCGYEGSTSSNNSINYERATLTNEPDFCVENTSTETNEFLQINKQFDCSRLALSSKSWLNDRSEQIPAQINVACGGPTVAIVVKYKRSSGGMTWPTDKIIVPASTDFEAFAREMVGRMPGCSYQGVDFAQREIDKSDPLM